MTYCPWNFLLLYQKQRMIASLEGLMTRQFPCLFSTVICVENIELHRQWLARVSSSCASLVSPLVTKSVDPDLSISTESTDKNLPIVVYPFSPVQQKILSSLTNLLSVSIQLHSNGDCSIIFARNPWPESVIWIPCFFFDCPCCPLKSERIP